jgi:parvulin-like peptidyl-prolyl isomerase
MLTLRRPTAILCAIGALVSLTACGGGSSPDKPKKPTVPADSVAIVEGHPILKRDFSHIFDLGLNALKAQQQPAPKAGTAEYEKLKQQALGYLFQNILITSEATKLKLKVDEKKVTDQLASAKQQAGGDKKWQDNLKKSGATEKDYLDVFRVQQLGNELYQRITKSAGTVTDADIQKAYEKDKNTTYKKPESRKVEHILIGLKDGATPKEKDFPALKEKALLVLGFVKKGDDFKKLMKKYSTDPGGGTYDVTPTGYDPAFTKASFALKTGEFTVDPVKSQFGYHIIKALADKTTAGFTPLTEVKDQIKQQLVTEKQQKAADDWLKRIKADYLRQSAFAPGYSLPPDTPAQATGTATASAATTTG